MFSKDDILHAFFTAHYREGVNFYPPTQEKVNLETQKGQTQKEQGGEEQGGEEPPSPYHLENHAGQRILTCNYNYRHSKPKK